MNESGETKIEEGVQADQKTAINELNAICETGIRFRNMSLDKLRELIEKTGLSEFSIDASRGHSSKEYDWYFVTQDGALGHLRLSPSGYRLEVEVENLEGGELSDEEEKKLETIQRLSKSNLVNCTDVLDEFLKKREADKSLLKAGRRSIWSLLGLGG